MSKVLSFSIGDLYKLHLDIEISFKSRSVSFDEDLLLTFLQFSVRRFLSDEDFCKIVKSE